jgi:hypothetical protein
MLRLRKRIVGCGEVTDGSGQVGCLSRDYGTRVLDFG